MTSTLFSETFLKQVGIDTLPASEQEQLIASIEEIVFEGVMLQALNELNEEQQAEFQKIAMDKNSNQETAVKFLRDNVAGFDFIVSEQIESFQNESLAMLSHADDPDVPDDDERE